MVVRRATWKLSDPLFRGDTAGGVQAPDPAGPPSIVRHVLYLEGAGRASPYLSLSESRDSAQYFAGSGRVYRTTLAAATAADVGHLSQRELTRLLQGNGQGDAAGSRPYQVAQARKYVEQWQEHLFDFRGWIGRDPGAARATLNSLFA